MAKYIDRDWLIDMISERNRNTCNGKMSCIQMKRMVESIPAADVAPVRHGRWIYHDDGVITCSECGNGESRNSHYCRYCGAKMD